VTDIPLVRASAKSAEFNGGHEVGRLTFHGGFDDIEESPDFRYSISSTRPERKSVEILSRSPRWKIFVPETVLMLYNSDIYDTKVGQYED
jgi:lipocalin